MELMEKDALIEQVLRINNSVNININSDYYKGYRAAIRTIIKLIKWTPMVRERMVNKMNACNCTLRAVTGDTKCCENCTNNTSRTVYGNTRIDIGVPVIHGHWIGEDYDGYADGCPVYYSYRCSKCNALFETDDEPTNFDYCPCCGAKMDEEGDDNERV